MGGIARLEFHFISITGVTLIFYAGVQAKPFPRPLQLDKLTVWKYIFGKDCVTTNTAIKIPGIVSSEAVILVLSLLRTLLNKDVTPTAGPATYIKVCSCFVFLF